MEFDELLGELAEDMACNAADLKAWHGELNKKHLRNLGRARENARRAKRARLKAFRQKKAARKAGLKVPKKRFLRVPLKRPKVAEPSPC